MPDSPTVHQRRLRVELRRAREAAELTQEQAANALEWSLSKIIRIEGGTVRVTVSDVRVMLLQYGVAPERFDEFLRLARAARESAWWSAYSKVLSSQMAELIGFESAAGTCREFDPQIIPGLLQTGDYAREILTTLRGEAGSEQIEKLVEVRLRRQDIFEGDAPPKFYFVIAEPAIRWLVGGSAGMRAQLAHLLEMAKRPNVTIEIVQFDRGANPGLEGPFKLIEFADPEDDDVLYLEGAQGELVGRDYREEIVKYRERFEVLRSISLGPEGSAVLLNTVAESL
ncbi:helix-turn-helix transcriptional regulator [Actinomadura sp. WMMA1423]|uniref:helix-turn-helix domain-containing protein n=1 Tax=Actinomadura sp. WMMA1423 TaxID=2591108 RepID=UPI00114673F8|nr:helix-turn-helix transcriptional regulator [Actinomadura sp. WMMA1423]